MWSAVDVWQILMDKTGNFMNSRAFLMHLVHAVLVNFNVKIREKVALSGHSSLTFVAVEYEQNGGNIEEFEVVEFN